MPGEDSLSGLTVLAERAAARTRQAALQVGPCLTPKQYAELTGFSLATVRRYLRANKLPRLQPGGPRGRIAIPLSALGPSEHNSSVPCGTSGDLPPETDTPRPDEALPAATVHVRAGKPIATRNSNSSMPRKRTNDPIQCRHFRWLLYQRGQVYQADGRSNSQDAGRHSLGTRDRTEALQLLHDLDATMAVNLKLAPPSAMPTVQAQLVLLEDGRKLYEEHTRRPRAIGGVKKATQKRNRAVFNKFILQAKKKGVLAWNHVTDSTLTAYATHLDDEGYAPKTV